MLYKKFIKTERKCPFCNSKDRKILEEKNAFLTYALAPYSRHHLLVIPKRHLKSFLKLGKTERDDVDKLIVRGATLLRKLGHEDFSVLVREGGNREKSVEHLHYHLIPEHRIGDLDSANNRRRILTAADIEKLKSELNGPL